MWLLLIIFSFIKLIRVILVIFFSQRLDAQVLPHFRSVSLQVIFDLSYLGILGLGRNCWEYQLRTWGDDSMRLGILSFTDSQGSARRLWNRKIWILRSIVENLWILSFRGLHILFLILLLRLFSVSFHFFIDEVSQLFVISGQVFSSLTGIISSHTLSLVEFGHLIQRVLSL